MASVGVGGDRRPGAATGTPAVTGGLAVIDGHPHAHSAREVGYP
jgi:hypothetical protein